MSKAGLARKLRVPASRIRKTVNGKRGVTADTALRLARYFTTTPEFWMRLQGAYDLELARRASAEQIEREVQPRAAR